MQFFGGLPIGVVEPREEASGSGVFVASLIDIAASKVKVLPERNVDFPRFSRHLKGSRKPGEVHFLVWGLAYIILAKGVHK
jgi:hypothetical protein